MSRARTPETPTVARFSVAIVIATATAAALHARVAHAQSWTEDAAVERALSLARLDELAAARAEVELGAGRAESAWPAIDLTYSREQTFGVGATGEDYLGVGVPLDLANRRGLRGEAYARRARAAELAVDELRRDHVATVRRLFHRTATGRARLRALEAWLVEIRGVLESVRDRVAAGDASRYDALRLEREHATGIARRDVERASLSRVETELAALLGVEPGTLEVEADLLPGDPPALASLLEGAAALPRVRLWDEHEAAARLDAEAGARGWIPELSLSFGWKGVDAQGAGRQDGFYGGVVLALPIFDLGIGARARAEAQARAAGAERAIEAAAIERELRGAHVEASRLADAARQFASSSAERSDELVRVASASYSGGEASLLELLDAERGAIEDRLALLDLALAAWDARIALDRAAADGGSP